jgi:nitroreductase
MFLEAFNQGLIMHEMGGFDVKKAIEIFKIPEDFEIGVMIAIGYQDKHSVLPERFREKAYSPRERRKLSEIAFVEEIGKSLQ